MLQALEGLCILLDLILAKSLEGIICILFDIMLFKSCCRYYTVLRDIYSGIVFIRILMGSLYDIYI